MTERQEKGIAGESRQEFKASAAMEARASHSLTSSLGSENESRAVGTTTRGATRTSAAKQPNAKRRARGPRKVCLLLPADLLLRGAERFAMKRIVVRECATQRVESRPS